MDCWENVPHSSQDYYPHYNLFQSSIFYDTDNFRKSYKYDECLPSESSEIEEKTEPPDKPPEAPPAREKRVVSRDELYQDPDLFRSKNCEATPETNIPSDPTVPPPQWGYDWTKQSWVKERAPVVIVQENKWSNLCEPRDKSSFANSKGESMIKKMGWQGGGLGKSGNGILRSISPEHVYAFRSSGFGQRTISHGPPLVVPCLPPAGWGSGGGPKGAGGMMVKGAKKATPKKDVFRTNMLLHILDFVQDDTETELLFDTSLRQHERRNIVNIVHSVVNDQAVFALGSVAQYDLALDIHKCNAYVLDTACHTEGETRQMCIYKEAPDDVYLVTPDDFLPKDDVTETSSQSEPNGMEMDDDENPFLKSIKKSIKKEEKEDEKITNKFEAGCNIAKGRDKDSPVPAAEKVLEFFLEFAEGEAYKDMRFLGTFTDEQMSAIHNLLHDVGSCPGGLPSGGDPSGGELARLLRGGLFRLREGRNGTTEIYKESAANNDKK